MIDIILLVLQVIAIIIGVVAIVMGAASLYVALFTLKSKWEKITVLSSLLGWLIIGMWIAKLLV